MITYTNTISKLVETEALKILGGIIKFCHFEESVKDSEALPHKMLAIFGAMIATGINKENQAACKQILREVGISQISKILKTELSEFNDAPNLAAAIYDLYLSKQGQNENALSRLRAFGIGSQVDSHISPEVLENRLKQNFEVSAHILLVSYLQQTAERSGLEIPLEKFLQVSQSIDVLMILFGEAQTVLSENYKIFVSVAEKPDTHSEEAVILLEQSNQRTQTASFFVSSGGRPVAQDEEVVFNPKKGI